MLTVGGWFDAEDLAGPLLTYRTIEQTSPGTFNAIVMGPWSHGGWSRGDGDRLGNLDFGSKTGAYYREEIEHAFFARHLKGGRAEAVAEATMFQTGTNEWRRYDAWPPRSGREEGLLFRRGAPALGRGARGGRGLRRVRERSREPRALPRLHRARACAPTT